VLPKSMDDRRTLLEQGVRVIKPPTTTLSDDDDDAQSLVDYYKQQLKTIHDTQSYVIYKPEEVSSIFRGRGGVSVLIFVNFEMDEEGFVRDEDQRVTLASISRVSDELKSSSSSSIPSSEITFVVVPSKEKKVFHYFGVSHHTTFSLANLDCVSNIVIINSLHNNGSQGLRTYYQFEPSSSNEEDATEDATTTSSSNVYDTLSTMVHSFRSNNLKSYVRSERVTSIDYDYNNANSLQVIKANTFPSLILNAPPHSPSVKLDPKFQDFGDSLIVFYAPWCGHSQRVLKVMEDLNREMANEILLGKIDATLNEVEYEGYNDSGGGGNGEGDLNELDDDDLDEDGSDDDAHSITVNQLPSIYYFSKKHDPTTSSSSSSRNFPYQLPYDRAVEFSSIGQRMDVEGFANWIKAVRAEGTERRRKIEAKEEKVTENDEL
jgi:thiol-disulfide isomerase/thioredoxin